VVPISLTNLIGMSLLGTAFVMSKLPVTVHISNGKLRAKKRWVMMLIGCIIHSKYSLLKN